MLQKDFAGCFYSVRLLHSRLPLRVKSENNNRGDLRPWHCWFRVHFVSFWVKASVQSDRLNHKIRSNYDPRTILPRQTGSLVGVSTVKVQFSKIPYFVKLLKNILKRCFFHETLTALHMKLTHINCKYKL